MPADLQNVRGASLSQADELPADIEPGFTQHRLEEDLRFLAFAMPAPEFDAFVEECVLKAKHRRRSHVGEH